MSASVIPLNSRQAPEADEDHRSGPMRCLSCQHEWIGVSSLDVDEGFECPKCKLSKGVILGLHTVKDEEHWVCRCKSTLFSITRQRVYCPNCGIDHKPWD